MKILIATGIYPPDIGGPATYSKLLNDELPKSGIDVRVLSFGEVRHLPKMIRHFVYFLKVLWHARGVDLIYAQDPVSVGFPAVIAAMTLRKKFALKVVGDYAWEQFQQRRHGGVFVDPEIFQHRRFDMATETRRRIERFVARRARAIIVPSAYLKRIVALWGIGESRITIIHNAFTPAVVNESKEELRRQLGLSGAVLFSAGRLVPWKGFSSLIEYMPDILKMIPDATLIVAGSGPDREKLEGKITGLHLGDSVKLLGQLPQDTLLQYLKAADVFVLNTGYEGLSHQLLEAMAMGTPVVTTNIGGNPEVVENGKDGVLVGYNDTEGFERAIVSVVKEGKGRAFAEHAKEKLSLFGKERMIQETIKTLRV